MKKLILLFFILSNCVHASMLWKLDNGIKLYNSKNYKAALIYFSNYINSNPNDEDGYFWLARTYLKQNNQKQANVIFQKAYAIALNEKNIDKIDFENNEFDNLEDYFDMAAGYWEEGNYKEALNYANMMLKIDPDCPSAYFIKAKIAQVQDDNVSAAKYLNNAILLNNSLLNTQLAKTLNITKVPELSKQDCLIYAQKAYYKGDIALSIKYLKQYIEFDNSNPEAYSMLANCYLKNNNILEAQNAISQGLKINDENVALLLMKAEVEYYNNNVDYDKYESTLIKAYGINPNNKNVLLKLGNFYIEQKKYAEAKKYFETLISVDDSLYEGYFGYIYTSVMTADMDNAQAYIKNVSSLKQNYSEVSYLLSLICYANAQYKEALNYIEDAIKKEKNPIFYLLAGKLNYILGNNEASIKYLAPIEKNSEAREYLILNYLKAGEELKAKELVNSSSELDKNRLTYKYYLYKTYKTKNNRELNSILKQKPLNLQDYIDLARVNFLEGKTDDAIKILSNAYKKFGNQVEIKFIEQEFKYHN